jgi:hypothetical protein
MSLAIEDENPKRLLELLAEVKRLLQDRAIELRRLSGVEGAQTSFEAASYQDGPVLEGYLEIRFDKYEAVCWCIDVHWDRELWRIEATLDRLSSGHQKTLRELPVESANSFREFEKILLRIVPELLALNIPEVGSDSWGGWPGRAQEKGRPSGGDSLAP